MKKIFFIIILTLLSVGCSQKSVAITPTPQPTYNYTHQLQIGGQLLAVEIADTPQARQQGLSDRNSMQQNQGMLFVFPNENLPAFWMPDMKFNLDFIWIAQNKIVGITNDVPAPLLNEATSSLPLYYPPSPVDEVLEVNPGWAEKNNIKVGDETKILN